MTDAEDGMIWDYARKNQAAIISKDEDFASGEKLIEMV